MEINNCPYLGIIDDPHTCANFADGANACHRIKPPMLLTLDYQRTTCLQAAHRECPGYVDGWKDGVPRSILRHNPVLTPAIREGLAWLLLVIPVILIFWAGFTGRLSFLTPNPGVSATNTPTSLPFFTRTPTETFTPTNTPTETLTSTTAPDTATPTQTDIRIATETGTLQPTGTATRLFSTALPNTPIPTNTSTQPPTLPPTQPPTTQPPPPTTTPQPTSTPQPTNTPTPDIRPTEP